tara:strand:+ start:298 stop:543 length:246 start_codon:yes stop_codon:yes gene_type:complete
MKLLKAGGPIVYKTVNGQKITLLQPEIYQRIYCTNCKNEVDSEEQAIGTCSQCDQPWSATKAIDIKVNVLEMPPLGAESGE